MTIVNVSKTGFVNGQIVRVIPYEVAKERECMLVDGEYHIWDDCVYGIDKAHWEQARAYEVFTIREICDVNNNFSAIRLNEPQWWWPEWALVPVDNDIDNDLVLCQFDNK